MKGLQTLIRKYLKDHEKHKRYLAIIMCLSMIVTFAVPMSLIMPAISMTNNADSGDDGTVAVPLATENPNIAWGALKNADEGKNGNIIGNNIYSPGELSLKTLLVGEGSGVAWAENCNDIDDLMDAAMDEYFLGIANDFCAFIEGDFAATDADAEGRVLIGGDLTFNGHKDEWNYQIGSGNYSDMTNLEATDNYKDRIFNFASVIVGGRMENINTLSTGYGHDRNGKKDWNIEDRKVKDADYHSVNINSQYAQDAYTVYYKPDEGLYKRFLIGNIDDSKHIFYEDDKKVYVGYTSSHSHDYPGDCGETCPHEYLAQTNELAQMYQYSEIPYIVQKSFEQIRERSLLLSKKKTVSAATEGEHTGQFVGPGTDSNVKTVYFNIDSWDKRGEIEFWDIPEGANIVVNVKGTNPELGTLKTKINGNSINNEDNERTNNHVDSQRILYNFYEAKTLDISGNFNGTILAPNADVTSPAACPGHLSGALIAKSFKGGLEFGYRPYRGAADILGSSSGYVIPVDKFDNNNKPLPGASFEIVDNDTQELVSAWISSDKTKYASIPTAVDYSGETDYTDITKYGTDNNIVITKNYTLEEVSAPDGYIKEENYYTITVTETIYKDYLLPNDNGGTSPQKVDVEVTIENSENSSAPKVLKFTVKDAYDNNNRQRRIYVKDAEGKVADVFAVDIDVNANGTQTPKAVKKLDSTVEENDSTVTVTYPPSIVTSTTAEKGDALTTTSASNTFTINPDKTECTVGDTVILNVSGTEDDISWDSNEKWSVTTNELNGVKQYELTVNQPGWLEITGTITDTDSEVKTGCCVVYVNPFAITNVSEISTDGTVTFTANQPANWSIDNTNLAVISSDTNSAECTVTFNENAHGNAKLTATYDNNNTATAELSVPEPKTSQIVNKVNSGTEITGVEYNTSSDFTTGEGDSQKRYYYSKDSLMVMPLPKKNLEFVNKPGLVLRKVDDDDKAVKGAKISLTLVDSETLETSVDWSYDEETGKGIVDLKKLGKNQVYKFSEGDPPTGYEKADDIYFTWNGDKQIKYWTGSETEPEPPDVEPLNLPDEHTIFMTDQRKLGAKITLKKVEFGTNKNLLGAKFSLYSTDDEENPIITGLDGNENIFDNETFKALDNKYAKNGYLLPGTYYLVETTFPTRDDGEEYENPGRIYFTVKDDYSIEKGIYVNHKLDIMSEPNYSWCVYKDLKLDYEKDSPVVIKDVVEFTIRADKAFGQCYVTGFAFEEGEASSTLEINHKFDTPQDITTFKIQDWWHDSPKITYAELITSDGTKYSTDSEEVGYSEFNDMLEVSDSTLKISNKIQGDERKLTVTKKWENDEDFTSLIPDLRPNEIKVQLYCTTQEINDISKLTGDMKCNQEGIESLITLDETNNWTYTWETLKNKDSSKIRYHYYVKEVDDIPNYDAEYSVDAEGRLVITNKLKTIDIKAVKKWEVDTNTNINKPATLNLTLQMKNPGESDEAWRDIRTITLTAADDWQKVIEGLPAGKEYRLMEKNPPTGWYCMDENNASEPKSEADDTLTITNKQLTAPLTIRKFWENDNENQRTSVKFKLYRTTKRPADQMPYPVNQTPEETQQDYARLLQYSLYFYDANMCGDQVNENSAYSWREDCHTNDDVVGGFHDAGDHVMFGLPQGYSASILSWDLYEFHEAYDELGQTPHAKIIIDYFCDFIVQCAQYTDESKATINKILVQKGNPTKDHSYWGTPELQEERAEDEFWWDSDGCADIAYEYAAALAAAYVNAKEGNFGGEAVDDPKYNTYLETAKKFFQFGLTRTNQTSKSKIEPDCYSSGNADDDRSWAATWLRLATEDTTYDTYLRGYNDINLNISWDHVETAAALLNAGHINTGNSANVANAVYNKIPDNQNYLFGRESGGWGNMRHNAAYQMTALVAAKYQNDAAKKSKMTDWAKAQMAIILGNNSESGNEVYRDSDIAGFEDISKGNSKDHIRDRTCFVTNFSKDTLLHPHYRATCDPDYSQDMGGKDNSEIIDGYDLDKNFLIGGLAGGWQDEYGQTYRDERSIYKVNEVACDYNACFVGAAAGLYAAYGTGKTYMIPEAAGVRTQYLQDGTVAGDYYKISEPTPAPVQSRSALPMLTMGMAKAIMAAESGKDADGTYYSINYSTFNTWVSVPEELNDVVVTKVKLLFDSVPGNGCFKYKKWRADWNNYEEVQISDATFKCNPSTIEINNKIPEINVDNWGSNFNVTEIRFYYDAGNSFTVTPSAKTLLSGDTVILETSGHNGTVTWESDNTEVATVDANGTVNAVGIGNAKIIGTDTEGKTGECNITVKAFSIEVNSANKTYVKKDAEFTVTSDFDLGNDETKFTFDSNMVKYVRKDNNGYVFQALVDSGETTITAKYDDNRFSSVKINFQPAEFKFVSDTNSVQIEQGESKIFEVNAEATWTQENGDNFTLELCNEDGTPITGNLSKYCKVTATGNVYNTSTIKAISCLDNAELRVQVQIVQPVQITLSNPPTSIPINESAIFEASEDATWSANPGDNVTLTPCDQNGNVNGSGSSRWCKVEVNEGATVNSNVTITATAVSNSRTATATFNVAAKQNIYKWRIQNPVNYPGNTLDFSTVPDLDGATITNVVIHNKGDNGNGILFFNGDSPSEATQTDYKFEKFPHTVKSEFYTGKEITSATVYNWYGLTDIEVWFYYDEPPKFEITRTTQDSLYPGDTAILTVKDADGNPVTDIDDADWTISPNGGSVTKNNNGTYTYTAGGKFGDIKISCSKDRTKGNITIRTNEITATPTDITVRSGTTDTPQIGVVPSGDITYESSDENVATVENGNVSFHNVGDAVITICRKGVPTDCKVNVHVLGALAVKGANENGEIVIRPNDQFTLEAINAIGPVTWKDAEGNPLTNTTITATESCEFTATDSHDGAKTTVTIIVKDMAEIVDITEDMDVVRFGDRDYIELTVNDKDKSDDNLWKQTIENLPITDEHGNYYFYYIVELDEYGNEFEVDDTIKGKGAKYIPISYDGNGQYLSENENSISVTNKKISDTSGELPMTGGHGTTRYYVTGIAIMSTAAAYYLIRRRRRRVAK